MGRQGSVQVIELFPARGLDCRRQGKIITLRRQTHAKRGRIEKGIVQTDEVCHRLGEIVSFFPHDLDREIAGIQDGIFIATATHNGLLLFKPQPDSIPDYAQKTGYIDLLQRKHRQLGNDFVTDEYLQHAYL